MKNTRSKPTKSRILVCTDPDTIHSIRFIDSLKRKADVGLFWFGAWRDRSEYGVPCFFFPPLEKIPSYRLRHYWSILIFNIVLILYKPDLIHVHREASWVRIFKRWAPNLPVCFTSWGHIPLPSLKGYWGTQLVHCDGFTGDSQALLDELHMIPGCENKPSMIFRFGISGESFHPAPPSRELKEKLGLPLDGRIIYSARSLRPNYNHETVLAAAPAVIQSFPNTFFVFVNNHGHRYADALDYQNQLYEQSVKLRLSEHVRFLEHHQDHSKVAELMQTADVVVSIPLADGFPATIFEAMACGAPLVVSDLSDYDGVLDETNSIRIHPKDNEALSEAIKILLGSEERRMALRYAGFDTVAHKGDMALEIDKLIMFFQEISLHHNAYKV